ncbi:MAG: hypothetical protein ACREJX_06395 [Polyangiaceae bacterium]
MERQIEEPHIPTITDEEDDELLGSFEEEDEDTGDLTEDDDSGLELVDGESG